MSSTKDTRRRVRSAPNPHPRLISGSEGSHLTPVLAAHSGQQIKASDYEKILSEANLFGDEGVALYVHLPFCPSRCLSCDHITTVSHDAAVIDTYLDHLEQEFELVTRDLTQNRKLVQLHLGGGTPNYLTDPQLLRLMSIIESYFELDEDTCASIEVAPKRTSQSQLQLLRGLGFSGIKFEVRDLDAEVQTSIGRSDSRRILEDVFVNAREAGFSTLSMDLVYGLPTQTLSSIRATVTDLIALAPDRLVCSGYSRRPDVFPHQRAIASPRLPSLADRLIMFNAVVEAMEENGYVWVGLDNFVREDDALAQAQDEQRLYHNWMGYNVHGSSSLLSFGVSGISEVGGACVQNHLDIDEWSAALDRGELPIRGGVQLEDSGRKQRKAVNNLLCNMEVQDFGDAMSAEVDQRDVESLEAQGILRREHNRIVVTEEGRYMLHHLCNHAARNKRWVSGF